jgi:hypothetical protein
MSKTFPKKSTEISMSVFPRLFFCLAFPGVSQRWEFKNTTKTFYKLQMALVAEFLRDNKAARDKKIQDQDQFLHGLISISVHSLYFILHTLLARLGRFSVRGVQKHDKKYQGSGRSAAAGSGVN